MKVLVIGSGGREHALAWKLAQSPRVSRVFVAPGNPGTAAEAKCENISIGATDIAELLAFAGREKIDLTVVGPEAPLVLGIVDSFRDAGLPIFGPSRQAAQLEGSKAFSKDFLARHRIPTAAYRVFTEAAPAIDYVREHGAPIVVKADGLAAGKGVIVAQTVAEAEAAISDMLGGQFGEAGARVVVEAFLSGEEASFIVMVDGGNILPMATSQDHKARDSGDTGPNTGGMGAYSPAPVVTPQIAEVVMETIIEPTVKGMALDGIPYTGFLYAGLMIDDEGWPSVLEFNCRFGDPETQPIMLRLDSDLVDLLEAGIEGSLDKVQCKWNQQTAIGVVMAAHGYPADVRTGDVIRGLDAVPGNVKVFQAGTRAEGQDVVTAGGRVLCVTALGDTVRAAQAAAYAGVKAIDFDGGFYRDDIGWRAVRREMQVANRNK
ncbi:MAG: phosphoribosylamine--glycine ligase [Halothiobacillus sp. 14-56-357]|jgi:phosphoribosylamine--glycine ligase|uniref:phosphoribosylamine--glycine ligase n=1 Tax=Halothiobacillus sp. 15-55-196 TaxID=1970382 RepID=UPI000BC775B3|nr:phosphoribosylamine--glycine ligase [Halothiobacillus sp. 15-55-196]OZB36643.1 MAG: phosphoribosylamine--glycine ligase [Halothiobacillus sp. 15-55-196]OZB56803.1 MAG: phosphoribosylamine--glycine ligase [Halothiobacillus sp. 14-56-357]OZB79056.1 MAG: phosphoribosylamine--glycine ligase [Halothiobacillus sp. 13-55-115]